MSSILVRPRSSGRSFELRVKHSLLAKTAYCTFDTREQPGRAGREARDALDHGNVPSWLQSTDRPQLSTIACAATII